MSSNKNVRWCDQWDDHRFTNESLIETIHQVIKSRWWWSIESNELIVWADNVERFSVDSMKRFIYVLTYRQMRSKKKRRSKDEMKMMRMMTFNLSWTRWIIQIWDCRWMSKQILWRLIWEMRIISKMIISSIMKMIISIS
jgi:hypothetical protein